MKARRKSKPLPSPREFEKRCEVALATLEAIRMAISMGVPAGKAILAFSELISRMKAYGPTSLADPYFKGLMDKKLEGIFK